MEDFDAFPFKGSSEFILVKAECPGQHSQKLWLIKLPNSGPNAQTWPPKTGFAPSGEGPACFRHKTGRSSVAHLLSSSLVAFPPLQAALKHREHGRFFPFCLRHRLWKVVGSACQGHWSLVWPECKYFRLCRSYSFLLLCLFLSFSLSLSHPENVKTILTHRTKIRRWSGPQDAVPHLQQWQRAGGLSWWLLRSWVKYSVKRYVKM